MGGLWWSASLSCRFESLFIHWESAREDQKLSKCARDTKTSGTVLGHRTQCFRWCCFITMQLRISAKLVKVGSQIGPDELVLTETHHFGVKHHWTKKNKQLAASFGSSQEIPDSREISSTRWSDVKQTKTGTEMKKRSEKSFSGGPTQIPRRKIFLRIHFFRHEPITIRPPIKILETLKEYEFEMITRSEIRFHWCITWKSASDEAPIL